MRTRAHWAPARCRGTVRVEDGVWISVRVRRRRPFECSDFGVLSLLAALIECGLFIAAFTGELCQDFVRCRQMARHHHGGRAADGWQREHHPHRTR